ncbi:hypothetical protein AAFF_G00192890, partial [Aldrovandia affinis]
MSIMEFLVGDTSSVSLFLLCTAVLFTLYFLKSSTKSSRYKFPPGPKPWPLIDSSLDQSEMVAEILKDLSNRDERVEVRKVGLSELMKLIRDNQLLVWDEKTILLLLLETLGDRE